MSKVNIQVDEFLAHYGVLGMKWGVRNAESKERVARARKESSSKRAAANQAASEGSPKAKKLAKAADKSEANTKKVEDKEDLNWSKRAGSFNATIDAWNASAQVMNSGMIDKINARHPKAHLDQDTPETRAYIKDYSDSTKDEFEKAYKAAHGSESPSGRFKVDIEYNVMEDAFPRIIFTDTQDVKHSVGDQVVFELVPGPNGKVKSIRMVKNSIKQSDLNGQVDEILAHYGILGMKWGVRREPGANGLVGKGKNPNYTSGQRKRDRQIYGGRGEKRINKALNKGDSISVARGSEKTRRDRVTSKNKYVRVTGKIVGAGAAIGAINIGISAFKKAARSPATAKIVNNIFESIKPGSGRSANTVVTGARQLSIFLDSPHIRALASLGAAKAGEMLAGDIAVNTRMRAHGYDPNRKY